MELFRRIDFDKYDIIRKKPLFIVLFSLLVVFSVIYLMFMFPVVFNGTDYTSTYAWEKIGTTLFFLIFGLALLFLNKSNLIVTIVIGLIFLFDVVTFFSFDFKVLAKNLIDSNIFEIDQGIYIFVYTVMAIINSLLMLLIQLFIVVNSYHIAKNKKMIGPGIIAIFGFLYTNFSVTAFAYRLKATESTNYVCSASGSFGRALCNIFGVFGQLIELTIVLSVLGLIIYIGFSCYKKKMVNKKTV